MGRFTDRPLIIPEGINVDIKDGTVTVKGEKGELKTVLHHSVKINKKDNTITINKQETYLNNADKYIGTAYRVIENMIKGLQKGYEKTLEIEGVGYRWKIAGSTLNMQLGLSHEINYNIPEGVKLNINGKTLTVSGIDKQLVGAVASKIKFYRPVEPYKGKGIRYQGQRVIRKAGKAGA